jgi:prolyl oligopeptidase
MEYQRTRKCEQVDNYHGVKVADPYRWLEDENSEETREWIKAQSNLTKDYFEAIPYRNKIKSLLIDIHSFTKYMLAGNVNRFGNRYFFHKDSGLGDTVKIYTQLGEEGEEEVFIDPKDFVSDGLATCFIRDISSDGKYCLFSISKSGSDFFELHVMEIETKKMLPDKITRALFVAKFNGSGFFYIAVNVPKMGKDISDQLKSIRICYHELGTSQEEDVVIFDESNVLLDDYASSDEKGLTFAGISVVKDGYLMVETIQTGYSFYLMRNDEKHNGFVRIIHCPPSSTMRFCGMVDEKFILATTIDAPNGKIVLVDPKNPEKDNWVTAVPEKDFPIAPFYDGCFCCGKFFVHYYSNASFQLHQFSKNFVFERVIELPVNSMAIITTSKDEEFDENKDPIIHLSTFTKPISFYLLNKDTGKMKALKETKSKYNFDDIVLKKTTYKSKDGTIVPITIAHKKDMVLNGENPAILFGYGGYGIIQKPLFSPRMFAFIMCGGVFAMAEIRGGGEFGEKWHLAGFKQTKQNTFDDFISAGEFLIKAGYTGKERLAIMGGSNGGTLVGTCAAQRPDLFSVVLASSGTFDMLRYQLFGNAKVFVREHGCSDNPEEFKYLYAQSPYHNVKQNTKYPAMLVMCAQNDNRVPPLHSFKFVSELQEAQAGYKPILLYYQTDAGHVLKSFENILNESVDMLCFTFKNMNFEPDL